MENKKTLTEILIEYTAKMAAQELTIKSLILGPKEYLVLKYEMATSGGVSDEHGNTDILTFHGYPIRVKVSQGIEPEIDPLQVHRYIQVNAKEDKEAVLSNGTEVRDLGESQTQGDPGVVLAPQEQHV